METALLILLFLCMFLLGFICGMLAIRGDENNDD